MLSFERPSPPPPSYTRGTTSHTVARSAADQTKVRAGPRRVLSLAINDGLVIGVAAYAHHLLPLGRPILQGIPEGTWYWTKVQ